MARIYDGDTLRLEDGTRVRLLGIDTPEIGRDGDPSEPLAEAAHRALERWAPMGTTVGVRHGRASRDRYERLLGHLFLSSGANLQRRLLEAGLATVLVVPPNTDLASCYLRAERRARARRVGLWALASHQPVEARSLSSRARGFRILHGTVSRVGEGRSDLWLQLAPRVALRIPRDHLEWFRDADPRALLGQRVEARGRVGRRRGELRVTILHPYAVSPLDRRALAPELEEQDDVSPLKP